MPNVVRTQADIPKASMEDLVHSYQELTGKRISGFASREVAETKVAMAIMSAKDKSGHLGVPQNSEPKVLTKAERDEIAADKGKDNPENAEPKPKSDKPAVTRTRRAVPTAVKATASGGTSKLQAESSRAQVLAFIKEQPNQTATYKQLEEKFKDEARSIFKLAEKGHIELIP